MPRFYPLGSSPEPAFHVYVRLRGRRCGSCAQTGRQTQEAEHQRNRRLLSRKGLGPWTLDAGLTETRGHLNAFCGSAPEPRSPPPRPPRISK